MKVIKTPSLKYVVIFYEKNETPMPFYTDKHKVVYHQLSPANMKPAERKIYESAFIYSRWWFYGWLFFVNLLIYRYENN